MIFEEGSALRTIGAEAFAGCINIAKIHLPEGLMYIRELCFSGSGLEEFIAPQGLKTINGNAFYDCGFLKRVVLNEGLEELKDCY